MEKRLLRIAKGCRTYGGGYRSDPKLFWVYQAGIQTVIEALERAIEDPNDTQTRSLEGIGSEENDPLGRAETSVADRIYRLKKKD